MFNPNPRGLFFTEDLAAAGPYSCIRKGKAIIKVVDLAINRPLTIVRYSEDTPYSTQIDQSIATFKAKGFDGIHCPDDEIWIAFEPYQVIESLTSVESDEELSEEKDADAEAAEVPRA